MAMTAAHDIVVKYTRAIGMEFRLDKCTVAHLVKWRLHGTGSIAEFMDILKHFDTGEAYTYLQDLVVVKKAYK